MLITYIPLVEYDYTQDRIESVLDMFRFRVAMKRTPKRNMRGLARSIAMNTDMYLLLLPSLAFITLFNVVPMYGILIAFKDYNLFAADTPWQSIWASTGVGLKHFIRIFQQEDFQRALANTLIISLYKIVFLFPLPIVFALLLNEVRSIWFQKGLQLIVYLPHFISWAVVAGIFISLLSTTGVVNMMLDSMGLDKVKFMMDNSVFRKVLIFTSGWKETGWNSIIYFAAIAGLDQQCFEAARIDGANRRQQIWHITLPGMMPTIVLMLILRVSGIMEAGFAQIFVMYNPTVYASADIIGTYVYRIGLGRMDFSTGTAVGLFNSMIGLILILSANKVAKRLTGMSIW